jgi:hypothetical protein
LTQERTYLDTNIIFSRKLSKDDIITIIESAIGHTFKYCSAFVVSEHKKVFLQTMRLLWTFFRESSNFGEVLDYIESHHWRSSQEKDRCIKIFNWVTSFGKSKYVDSIVKLENLIFTHEMFFFGDIDVLESEVNCPFANITIHTSKEITNVSFKCSMKCSISDFMKDQKENLIEVLRGIRNITHLQLIVAVLKMAIKNPEECDESMCRTLTDVIVILEAQEDFLVCSNNEKDFEPICRVLGKRFLPIRY